MPKFGPGTLKIGNTGSEIEVSCLVNSCTISSDNDQADSTTKLCGTVVPGAISFTYTLGGNVDTDSNDAQGLFALSQSAKGQQLPFEFTPNTGGTKATGTIVITPLDFGGEDFGADMTSDFEWNLVGEPAYDFTAVAPSGWWANLVVTPDPSGPQPVRAAPLPEKPAAASKTAEKVPA